MNRKLLSTFTAVLLFVSFSAAQQTTKQTPRQEQKKAAAEVQKKGAAAAQAKPWKQIPVPPLPAFHPVQPKRVQLANGMIIFLQEDHELPLITAVARIRGGARVQPATKVGLVDIYGEVWRTGGTKTKTGDQLDDYLEARAAKVETDSGDDSTSISLNCLKQDFNDVFSVFLDVLHNPEFREDKIDLAKKQMNTAIARRNDDIGEIASRESEILAYGKNNPYARIPEYSTVAAVTRDDLLKWHQQFAYPNNIIFGIVGDFDSAEMEAKLHQAFDSWQKGPEAEPPNIKFAPPKPGFYFIAKNDVNQSEIEMVTLGIERSNPDYFAISVMNEIFGGGFASRLMKEIRTRQGLAYSVGGGIGAAFDHPGIFRLAMGTKVANTAQAITALNQQIADLVKVPPTEDELKLAKDTILNSFIFRLDTPEKVLRERMADEFYGYPADFLERYRAGVEKTTIADVNRVAQKYVHPGQFAILVVGTDEAGKELAQLGPVNTVDITIPPPPGTQAASVPKETTPEARMLMAKVVEGMGGAAKVASVKSLRSTGTNIVETPQGEMQIKAEGTVVFPDKVRTVLNTPMGPMTMVYTPASAFMSMSGQTRDMPPSQRGELANSIKRDPLNIAQHANDPKYSFAVVGTEKIGDTAATVVNINANGTPITWYVDPQTGRVLRENYSAVGPTGPVEVSIDYSDWKNIDGIILPMAKVTNQNGKRVSTERIEGLQINPEIDPKAFEKTPTQAS